jgi:hypothetical protein
VLTDADLAGTLREEFGLILPEADVTALVGRSV